MVKSQSNLSNVKANSILMKSALRLHVMKQFTTSHKVHNKVDPILSLENKLHLNNKGVIHL